MSSKNASIDALNQEIRRLNIKMKEMEANLGELTFKAKFGDFASLAIQSVISAFESMDEKNNWDDASKPFYKDRRFYKVDLKEIDQYVDDLYEKDSHKCLIPCINSEGYSNTEFEILLRFSSDRNNAFHSGFGQSHTKESKIALINKYQTILEGNPSADADGLGVILAEVPQDLKGTLKKALDNFLAQVASV